MELKGNYSFEEALAADLGKIREAGLHRELRRMEGAQGQQISHQGRFLWNFASNDYLGLANDPILKAAGQAGLEKDGAGSGASRLISGSLSAHHKLEEALAKFKGTESALTFSSGYSTALGVIPALISKQDVVIVDKLAHACIIDGARLSGATLRAFHHNDVDDLEKILQWASRQKEGDSVDRPKRTLIITESLFSMDGDQAPLNQIAELKDRYGAWLMVDEAHATGVFGEQGRGLIDALGLHNRVEVQMGTLGKALGSAGGFICGSNNLINLLVNKARSFIFSTAPSPVCSDAARAAVEWLPTPAGARRVRQLWERIQTFGDLLGRRLESPIVPWIVGAEQTALERAECLREAGFFVPAIRYPTVARGSARLRITLSAGIPEEALRALAKLLREWPSA